MDNSFQVPKLPRFHSPNSADPMENLTVCLSCFCKLQLSGDGENHQAVWRCITEPVSTLTPGEAGSPLTCLWLVPCSVPSDSILKLSYSPQTSCPTAISLVLRRKPQLFFTGNENVKLSRSQHPSSLFLQPVPPDSTPLTSPVCLSS